MRLARRLAAVAVLALMACEADRGAVEIRPGSASQEIQGGTFDGTSSNVVAVLLMTGGGVGICSGSLIAPNLVLTAHHCVANVSSGSCSGTSFGTNYGNSAFAVSTSATAAATQFNAGMFPTVNNTSWFGVSAVRTPSNNICGGDMAVLELSTSEARACGLTTAADVLAELVRLNAREILLEPAVAAL